MDAISDWISKNNEMCRPQDIFAFIQTLAVLNHQPANAEQLFPVSSVKIHIFKIFVAFFVDVTSKPELLRGKRFQYVVRRYMVSRSTEFGYRRTFVNCFIRELHTENR